MLEIYGWYGFIAVLVAYFLANFRIISVISPIYIFLNITGATGITIISFYKKAYQPAVLNLVWVAIALVALFSLLGGTLQ
ncbi:MAG: hypothetical protein HYW77_02555 [Parcubacteria group bacterium]|nr:hypothetical protein [Parcubacteria group bacterium]